MPGPGVPPSRKIQAASIAALTPPIDEPPMPSSEAKNPAALPRRPSVSGSVIYHHFGHPCSYRVHLDLFGDRSQRSVAGPVGRYLMERGNRHEYAIFDAIKKEHPDDWASVSKDPDADHEADLERRRVETEAEMRRGVRYIFHGIIQREGEAAFPRDDAPEIRFRGETDILVREDIPSEFGDFSYRVGDVKSSRNPRFAQVMQVTFYSWILEAMQGRIPETGFIVTGEGSEEDFQVEDCIWTLRHFVEEEVWDYSDPERAFYHLDLFCSSCHWLEHCQTRAKKEDDLSLIPGCRRFEKHALQHAGIKTRKDLLARDDAELRQLGRRFGNRLDGFRDLRRQASAAELSDVVLRQHPREGAPRRRSASTQAPDLYGHRGPYLIVSSIPDYYHGDEVLLAARLRRRADFNKSDGPKEADRIWCSPEAGRPFLAIEGLLSRIDECIQLLERRRERPLVVFCDHALPRRLRRFGEQQGRARARLEQLHSDAAVLAEVVDRTWFLPSDGRDIALSAQAFGRERPEASVERLRERLSLRKLDEALAEQAFDKLDEIAEDYEIDADALRGSGRELRFLLVRELRRDPKSPLLHLLELELADELDAAEGLMQEIIKL